MGVILREIIPDGTQWGILGEILPDWLNLEFGQDLKGASSISFDYANDGAHADLLRNGMYIVAEVDGKINYYDSVFYMRELMGSKMPDSNSRTTKYAGVTLRQRLDQVKWLPAIGSNYADAEMFRYTNVTPGTIIKAGVENFWSRAKSQFNDDVEWLSSVWVAPDTNWRFRVDEVIPFNTSVSDMITKYQDLGIATARFMGFQLMTSHYDWYQTTALADKTDEVQLKIGLNLKQDDYSESMENLITALLVQGAPDPFLETTTGEAPANVVQWVFAPQEQINKWGYHESVLEVSDASNPDTLKAIGENYIRRYMEPRSSHTYTMVDNLYDPYTSQPLDAPRALVDFQCGDSILILNSEGAHIEKVYAITMSYANPNQPVIGLTLNDYFDEWQVTFDQRLKRLGV